MKSRSRSWQTSEEILNTLAQLAKRCNAVSTLKSCVVLSLTRQRKKNCTVLLPHNIKMNLFCILINSGNSIIKAIRQGKGRRINYKDQEEEIRKSM